MEAIIATFHIDWKIIIAQAINFAVVFTVLYIYALKPLSKLMSERSGKIETGIADAKQSKELLEKVTEEYNQNTKKLGQMAVEAKKELARELEQIRAENTEKARVENDAFMKKRAMQMEADKKTLVDSARAEIVELAMMAAKKIMEDKNK